MHWKRFWKEDKWGDDYAHIAANMLDAFSSVILVLLTIVAFATGLGFLFRIVPMAFCWASGIC